MPRVRSIDNMAIMKNAMSAAMLRHEILADNFANASTPGFKRSDISFKRELQKALHADPRLDLELPRDLQFDTRSGKAPEKVKARVIVETDTWSRNDGNNVDPEVENARLAENTLYYQTLASRVQSMVRGLRQIISQTPQG